MPSLLFAAVDVEQKISLYHSKQFSKLSKELLAQTSAFTIADRYLLFKSLQSLGDQPRASGELNKLSGELKGTLRFLYLHEKIQVLRKENNTKGLLELLAGLKVEDYPTYLTRNLILAIKSAHKAAPIGPVGRKYLERGFERLKFTTRSPTLLRLYLELLPSRDSNSSWALVQLFQVADIGKLPLNLKKRFEFIHSSPSRYSTEILAHFQKQKFFRNYTYIRERVPKLLPQLKYVDRGAFEGLRNVYFATYIRSRKYSKALKDLSNSKKMAAFDFLEAEKWALQLKLYLKLGRLDLGLGIVNQLAESQYNNELNIARFSLGKSYFNDGKWIEAFEQLRKVDGNEFSEKDKIRLQWDLFMVNLRIGHLGNMQKIAAWAQQMEFKDKRSAARFCYWGYKLGLYRKGTYLNCYQKFPTTYYGLRSKVISQPYGAYDSKDGDVLFKFNRRKLSDQENQYLQLVDFLYQIGEVKVADGFVNIHKTSEPDLSFFEQLRKLLAKHQRYYLSYNLVQANYSALISKEFYGPHYIMPLNYPLAFKPLVLKYAKEAKVEAALVFGVMREESRYRDYVRSGAGAVGLLQLMPKTARFVGRLHRKRVKTHQLVDAATNLQLGSWYLQRLSKKYDGDLAHILAAYNGGSRHVKRWMKNVKEGDQDYFVELITFPETRNYVKRVLKSYYLYQKIYGPL